MATRNPAPPLDDDEETARPIPGTRQLLETPEPEDVEQTVIDRLRGVLASNPADRVKVKIYRVDPKTPGRLAWCQDYTPGEFEAGDLEMIRTTWGPGVYQIRIIGATGIAARTDVTISAPLAPANPAPVPVVQDSGVSQALQMLAESQAAILQALQNRPDPTAQMMASFELMKAMREAMGPTVQPVAPPVSSPVTQLQEMLTTMRLFKEAAKEVENPESAEPSLMSLLPGVLDLVKTGIQGQPTQSLPAPIAIPASIEHPARVAHNPAPESAPISVPETSESDEMMILILRGQLATLCKMAADGKPAAEGGEFLYENLPDELLPHLSNESWFELLAQFAPIVRKHEAWIREAKTEADKLFSEEPEDPETPPAA